jgi:GDP-L-fucose synthase
MLKILATGGTSFIGRNVLPFLKGFYEIDAPHRNEFNVTNKENVDTYLQDKSYDVLLHLAAPHSSSNPLDREENKFDDMTRAFLNLEYHAKKFKKVIYTGSGAEYDKSHEVSMADEDLIGKTLPKDAYGFAKYIMNKIARSSKNIYNLRVFGCYGPFDEEASKFIRHAISCCLNNEAISIKQDCHFDYLYAGDLGEIIRWFIEHKPKYHDYNVVTGKPASLYDIAKTIAAKMKNNREIIMLNKTMNNEYTAVNKRIMQEISDFQFTSLNDGIDKQIAWQRNSYEQSTDR